jgi:hypothetical protein
MTLRQDVLFTLLKELNKFQSINPVHSFITSYLLFRFLFLWYQDIDSKNLKFIYNDCVVECCWCFSFQLKWYKIKLRSVLRYMFCILIIEAIILFTRSLVVTYRFTLYTLLIKTTACNYKLRILSSYKFKGEYYLNW